MIESEYETNPLRKIPTRIVPPTTTDIGQVLRQAREKKGHTLDVVCQHTRISKKYIEAMEANRLEEFPAVAYLRGFLKCYCEYLDVEFEPLWKSAFPEAAPKPQAAPEPPETPHPRVSAITASTNILPLVFLAVAVVTLIVMWAARAGRRASEEERTPVQPIALAPSAASEPRLALDFKRDAWVRVSLDGEVKFEGRVPQGTHQDWKAKKAITLRSSSPADLSLTLNGAPYSLPAPDASGDYRIEAP